MKLKEYEVLYVERAENTVYVCQRPPESKLYRVIESTDRERIAKYIKYFAACKPMGFYEDFCLNEKYYAVFRVPDGIHLKKAGETLTAQKVVRALAIQDPPLEIAVKILSPEHIFVCGDELEFAYDLPETDLKITRECFFEKLADFIDMYCETEADLNAEKWLEKLRGGKFEDLISVYMGMPDTAEERDIPDKERFKKIKDMLPKIIAVIAVAAAIITAAAFALDQGSDDIGYSRIDSLGTIDLTEN
ncbi:MAG: hypothetical protein J1F04_07455 [Oscillospiraceae bacterium]|nr:hypothetical protein [Oscillospiraceae bacterium]